MGAREHAPEAQSAAEPDTLAPAAASRLDPTGLLALQRTIGNAAGMNQTMREGEARFSTNPWRFTGLGDNPRR